MEFDTKIAVYATDELKLPDENGGAVFAPGLPGYLQAVARGEI